MYFQRHSKQQNLYNTTQNSTLQEQIKIGIKRYRHPQPRCTYKIDSRTLNTSSSTRREQKTIPKQRNRPCGFSVKLHFPFHKYKTANYHTASYYLSASENSPKPSTNRQMSVIKAIAAPTLPDLNTMVNLFNTEIRIKLSTTKDWTQAKKNCRASKRRFKGNGIVEIKVDLNGKN